MPMPERVRAKPDGQGWWALGGLAALICALRAGVLLFDHSLNAIDGALQTWFALDHFAQGQQLGRDFQSYLGITMVLALVPVFLLFGQTLFASTVSASAMVVAGAFSAAYAIAWMLRPIPRRARWQAAIVLLFVFYVAGRLAGEVIGLPYPATFDPGVSLRPLRGFLPFLVLPVFVMSLRMALHTRRTMAGGLALGLVAGAGLLWSNDAGIPLVLALGLALVLALWRRPAALMRMLAGVALGLATSAAAILLVATRGAPGPWLQYNFRDVAGDQFWFFAPWERSTRILSPLDLPNILRHADLLSGASLVVLMGCAAWAMLRLMRGRGSPVRGAALVFVGASVLGTALIPQIGGHVGAEYNGITFVLGACAPLILGQRVLWRWAKPLVRRAGAGLSGWLVALAALGLVGAEGAWLASVWASTDRSAYDAGLGFYVTPAYAADLAAMRRLAAAWDAQGIPQDRRLLSVYTSPLDIAAGTRSPAPVGSLIHALGRGNRTFVTALVAERRVAAVTTIAPDYSGWEGWITRAHAPFFAALHQYYRPVARNNQQVLWAKRETPAPPPAPATCRVTAQGTSTLTLAITAAASGLAIVTLTRRPPFSTGRGAMLTVTEASPETAAPEQDRWADFPRYGIANAAELTLLAPVMGGQATRLTLDVMDGSAIGTATCTAAAYAAPEVTALPPLPQGIARHLAEVRR